MICRIWREHPSYLLSKILSALPRNFGNSFNTSCYANSCPKTPISFHWLGTRELFWHRVSTSFHGDLRPKNWNSFSLFPLTKRALLPALGFWPIIWPLSSSSTSSCHAIDSGYNTDLCIPFSFHPFTECRQVLALILTWIRYFVQQADRGVDLHSYSSFKGHSLGPVHSNTEG